MAILDSPTTIGSNYCLSMGGGAALRKESKGKPRKAEETTIKTQTWFGFTSYANTWFQATDDLRITSLMWLWTFNLESRTIVIYLCSVFVWMLSVPCAKGSCKGLFPFVGKITFSDLGTLKCIFHCNGHKRNRSRYLGIFSSSLVLSFRTSEKI